MEPRIRYVKTGDGVSIAYWTLGEGAPLVHMPALPASHIEQEWQIPEVRCWYERLAEGRQVVRYDSRGAGLSDRDISGFSLDALVQDLDAVITGLGDEKVALFGSFYEGMAAIVYAARWPERVSHLVLWHSWARTADITSSKLRGVRKLLQTDWDLYIETLAHVFLGWSEGERARHMASVYQEAIAQQTMQAFIASMRAVDVTESLERLTVPTLVLHRRQAPFPQVDSARVLASRIRNARLALLEGSSGAQYLGDMEAVASAIDEFLDAGEEAEPKTELPEGMAVILFADIADSTTLTERLGDTAFREKARELDGALRAIIRECGGVPVEGKLLGDGVLAVFTSARQAIECALRCNAASEPVGLPLHLGIHAGDVIREENNVYGGSVNIASRISGLSAPGEVLVSDTVRGLARTSAGVAFDDRGEHELKGVADPQRLFAVREGSA